MDKKEEIRNYLVNELSERIVTKLSQVAKHSNDVVNVLWELIVENSYPVSWRAAWVYAKVAYSNPSLVVHHLPLYTKYLNSFTHDGQKREILRVILLFPLENQDMGLLLNTCFSWISTSTESAAVKVHSMEIVYRISEVEPDIKPELKLLILQQISDGDPSFKSRGTKILQKMSNVEVWDRM